MIWGYPHFRKPPCVLCCMYIEQPPERIEASSRKARGSVIYFPYCGVCVCILCEPSNKRLSSYLLYHLEGVTQLKKLVFIDKTYRNNPDSWETLQDMRPLVTYPTNQPYQPWPYWFRVICSSTHNDLFGIPFGFQQWMWGPHYIWYIRSQWSVVGNGLSSKVESEKNPIAGTFGVWLIPGLHNMDKSWGLWPMRTTNILPRMKEGKSLPWFSSFGGLWGFFQWPIIFYMLIQLSDPSFVSDPSFLSDLSYNIIQQIHLFFHARLDEIIDSPNPVARLP